MAQRLLRVIVPSSDRDRLLEILDQHGEAAEWSEREGTDAVAVEALIPAGGTDPLLDALETAFQGRERFRMLLLPVAASVPRPRDEEEEDEEEAWDVGEVERGRPEAEAGAAGARGSRAAPPTAGDASEVAGEVGGGEPEEEEKEAAVEGGVRVSREELYAEVTDLSGLTTYYVVMVALSAVVASVGILRNSPAVIIGAMVIAPLLGPNMALALATTLGDVELGREAVLSTAVGVAVAFAVAAGWGAVAPVDAEGAELLRLTRIGYGEIVLALAAGGAGVLSVSRGTATALVGVMVAVALLPPLVACGLLVGSGNLPPARDAFVVVVANVVCINLAGVVTFLLQGIRPRSWWEAERARTATRLAVVLWIVLLAGLVYFIARARGEA